MSTADDRRPRRPSSGVRRRSARVRRRWTALLVAVAVAAVLAPAGWLLTRPAPQAGLPLEQALAPGGTTPSPASPSTPPVAPSEVPADPAPAPAGRAQPGGVVVRDASPGAAAPRRGADPVRLQVPSLGVDAAVDPVGVMDDGAMVVPAEVDRVGWYRYGPGVGAPEGNAVLAGHVDTVAGGPGALVDLRGVEVGAEVLVGDATGATTRYEVVSRERITKTDLPVETIFAREGSHRLVVITCGGDYLPGSRRYADNVVVTAVPVPVP
ncbi:class F sortase [Aquipuribacter hungaricus]|uniref:Class F sortase n=1 Tax=Aquipuribacter hungaricus TaxID=545624 RepID=A0ABV7WCK0_9MICO